MPISLFFVLFIGGGVLTIAGYFSIFVYALRKNPYWGIGVLLVPPLTFYFIWLNFESIKVQSVLLLGGLFCLLLLFSF